MRILFTRNNTIVSRLIRRVTGEPVSHVAIQDGDYVLHSNFLGVHVETVEKFYSHSSVYESVGIPEDYVSYQKLWERFLHSDGSSYDFRAMFYLALRSLFPNVVPKQNLWQVSGAYICTEFVTLMLDGKPDCMITPHRLYLQLLQRLHERSENID